MARGYPDYLAGPAESITVHRQGAITRTTVGTGTLGFAVAAGFRQRILGWNLKASLLTEAAAGGMSLLELQAYWFDDQIFHVYDEVLLYAGAPSSGVGSAELATGWVPVPGGGIVLGNAKGDGVAWELDLIITNMGAAAPTRLRAAIDSVFLVVQEATP